MKRKKVISKRMQAALLAHDKMLRKHGIDPAKKPELRGAVDNPLHASTGKREQSQYTLSDTVPASGNRAKAKPVCDLPIAQVYHKGPIMVVTDMRTLEGSKRRN